MTNLENQLGNKDDIVLVQGDTNSVLATSLLAVKLKRKIVHIEAGLRSFDWRMPEEHNRRMVDHISDLLFAPTKNSYQNLIDENVTGSIHISGNYCYGCNKRSSSFFPERNQKLCNMSSSLSIY